MGFVQHKLIASALSYCTCRQFIMRNSAIWTRCSPANAEKFQQFPQRVRVTFPRTSVRPEVLRTAKDKRIYPLQTHADAPRSFPAFGVRTRFGHGLSINRLSMDIPNYWLAGELCATYPGAIIRSFSQIPRAGTRSRIVKPEDGESSYSVKVFDNKSHKWPKAFAHKRNETSSNVARDGNLSTSNDSKVTKSSESSFAGKSTQTSKGIEKPKQQSGSKKKQQNQSSGVVAAPNDIADPLMNAGKKSPLNKSTNNRIKQSPKPVEVNSASNSATEVVDGNSSTKKSARNSNVKGKSVKEASSPLKSGEDLTVSINSKASRSQSSSLIDKSKSRAQKTWPQLYPPTSKSVLVVESVTKAKLIQRYLGEMFEVLPSYGHVRDLAARSGSVRPDDDFSMVWEVPSPAWSHLKSIKVALSGAKNLILASDPDREGEAIAWHIVEMLRQQDALREDITVARVVFNEITESSIKTALQAPREIDSNLVHAYLARRALDYLIGFNVSPLLWRKLPGCQSAGRVQSAALALICDREKEIDGFKAQEYWTIDAQFHKKDLDSANNIHVPSQLIHFDSKKLNQLSISSSEEAKKIEEKSRMSKFEVIGSKTSKVRMNPPPPYITSTLQQDAANKLNFTASYTMKVAQKLYEGVELSDGKATGLITYMRTDGLHLSDEAAKGIQAFVTKKYGHKFVSKTTRKYFKKVKNAQEAHEAIRPTDIQRLPSTLAQVLDEDSMKLYTLIWSRAMACQMEPAIIEHIQVDIGNANKSTMFHSTCSRFEFLGYQAVNEDTETVGIRNSEDNKEFERCELFEILSNLKCGEPLSLVKVESDQHFTLPPPRYSEGSLVKKLEELGIGRPSTYATTIKTLTDRNYVTMENRALYPEFRGRMVSAFLSHYFSEVTDYSFTADMETELDNVSGGMTEWKGLLKDYWSRFSRYCQQAGNVDIRQVEKMLEKTYGDFLFSTLRDGNRTCPSCMEGTLVFRVSRFGAGYFIGCDQHPKCKYIAKTLYGEDNEEITSENKKNNVQEPKLLGLHPGTNEKVLLKCGPYGYYAQLGEDRKGYLPKRASLSNIKDVDSITLEQALELLKYPVILGNHPDDDHPVVIKLAKVGFSIRHRRTIASVPKNLKPNEITLEKALELLQSDNVRRCGRPKSKPEIQEPLEVI